MARGLSFQPLSLPEGYAAVSGASSLPLWSFQLANVSSGLLWPLLLLAPALSASVCGEKTLSFKEIPQVRDML